MSNIQLFNGDCLEVMRSIPDNKKYTDFDISILLSLYEITRDGEVINKKNGRRYTPTKDYKGYLRVRLPYPSTPSSDGRRPFKVHRLVAMCYLDNYSEWLQVNHKNGIKDDNRVENLEMVTNKDNVLHAWRTLDATSRRSKLESRRNRLNGRFE